MELESGQQLHHYPLVEKIGEGGMGVVWKPLDTLNAATHSGDTATAQFSDDGKWIAYVTRESGQDEVRPLFRVSAASIWTSHDVSPDGPRLVVNTPLSEDKPQPIVLVQNWKYGLER